MKEWKKPICKVVVLKEADLLTSSSPKFGSAQGEDISKGRSVNMWEKQPK